MRIEKRKTNCRQFSRWHHTPQGSQSTGGAGLFSPQWLCWIFPPMLCGWVIPRWPMWSLSILIRASMLWICWALFPCMLGFLAVFWWHLSMTIWWGEIFPESVNQTYPQGFRFGMYVGTSFNLLGGLLRCLSTFPELNKEMSLEDYRASSIGHTKS